MFLLFLRLAACFDIIEPSVSTRNAHFPTTRWTLILASGDESTRRDALDWLCERYWYPIYAFLRRRGYDPAAAQDLTQSFFTSFLQRRSMEGADPDRGRFRSYLLGALKNFLSDRHDHDSAARRGGGIDFLSLSMKSSEELYLQSPPGISPEMLYEQQWALRLIDRVLDLLRAEQEAAGKAEAFHQFKNFISGEGDYRQAAAALGINEAAARVAVHRLRRRYRELLTAEISETLSDPGGVRDEIRYLIGLLSA
jgi:RNA polymerase sigma-70 factor (ECF subfamily)